MWFDNEQFLKIDNEYRKHGLTALRFPCGSGDLNPIENVWAQLRKDLAIREFEDLKNDTVITTLQFKQRASQLLTSYGYPKPGKKYSYLENLLRGMPKRLQKCKDRKYGSCGK